MQCVQFDFFRLDVGGLAQQKGMKIGDQIGSVNGTSFDNITHANAVELLRSNPSLVITVKVLLKFLNLIWETADKILNLDQILFSAVYELSTIIIILEVKLLIKIPPVIKIPFMV